MLLAPICIKEGLPMQWMRTAAVAVALPALAVAQTGSANVALRDAGTVRTDHLATLEFPWGMAYLPDGRLLVTEKPGRLRVFEKGRLSAPVTGLPSISYRESQSEQGGLLDVATDPDFATNRTIYLSYVEEAPAPAGEKDTGDARFGQYSNVTDQRFRGGAVASATLDGTRLSNVKVIWRQQPKMIGRGHFGHRLVFARDGALFITSGERMRFDPAQDPKSNLGKIVRLNRDGSQAENWSIGHRNMLSAAVHPSTGQLWVFEMGPLGGDELNLIQKGGNYGWPVVSNGDNYDKSAIPDHDTRKEFIAPIKTWTPVISPSGAQFYDGTLFPWKNDLFVGGLSSMAVIRLTIDGNTLKNEERIDMKRRIRDVLQARDGALLVVTDEKDGALLRLTPEGGKTR
jgi:glucose/arabinose dehydrogenase